MKNEIMELAWVYASAYMTFDEGPARAALQAEVERVEALAKYAEHIDATPENQRETMLHDALVERDALRTELATKSAMLDEQVAFAIELANQRDAYKAELAAAKADAERMNHLVANAFDHGANIHGQHTWGFLWGKGWTTGASFREAVDNAKKGQTE